MQPESRARATCPRLTGAGGATMLEIQAATTAEDFDEARALFTEYAESLDFQLCFQSFDKDLAGIREMYGPPGGRILLARWHSTTAGCVALRDKGAGVCEMKRLYVKPDFRGKGIGLALAESILEEARGIGYTRMRLDTLERMPSALALYRSMGFREISAYCHNPLADVVYLEIGLD